MFTKMFSAVAYVGAMLLLGVLLAKQGGNISLGMIIASLFFLTPVALIPVWLSRQTS
ncbi:hypothetical protein [Cytobacillus sp. IB215665]|uniref:hypothetical protein n=1 Tax=Cytobacillus sp. IB215665 TaxID=3097357 RepID=UPI002A142DAE|nr:hypothetical protein [Cytobacillus sp. IB215665]MDX8367206.1 hypothetical protein [Cytobacillus sp. IB215665]